MVTETYELACDECGADRVEYYNADELFCYECTEVTSHEKLRSLQEYRVIIAVDGTIDGTRVSGVTSRTVSAEDTEEAKNRALSDFREDPDYNTDISVNKARFPDGEYLDNWGYDVSSARVVHVEDADEAEQWVRWRHYGEYVSKGMY